MYILVSQDTNRRMASTALNCFTKKNKLNFDGNHFRLHTHTQTMDDKKNEEKQNKTNTQRSKTIYIFHCDGQGN